MDKSTSLDHVMLEERAKMFSSLAINHSLKETGTMQATQEIIAASQEKELNREELAALEQFREQTGIDATAEGVQAPQKALTKKQLKAAKYAQKNMMRQLQQFQRQGQASHIMNRLFQHSIRTPEQARHIQAHDLAKLELRKILGDRQAEAFFGAKADTKTHDFFPKATIEANPKLMTSVTGEARTLSQVFEYFIYKHFMILTEKAGAEVTEPLNTSIDWATEGTIPEYKAYEEAPVEAAEAEETAEAPIA
uniref:Uncharacterized protein n=1 Tax=Pseudomonas phage RVTF4 TaxID=3236931 RepID=A0AB39CCK8_9VIRU